MRWVAVALISLGLLTVACGSDDSDDGAGSDDTSTAEEEFTLTSSAFGDGDRIPDEYAFANENVSPPLSWVGVPEGTEQLAITVVDPDARNFVHWVVVGIDPAMLEITEGVVPGAAIEGLNQFGESGWGGPAPPAGDAHSYLFTLHALSGTPAVEASTDHNTALAEIEALTTARAELRGEYISG